MKLICRRANVEDSRNIAFLLYKLKTLYSSCTEKNINDFFDNYITTITEIIDSTDSLIYVIEKNNKIIGYLSGSIRKTMHTNGNLVTLEEIYILSEYRRQGYGTLLWNIFEEQIKKKKIQWIEVVSAMNLEGQKEFYSKIGFVKYSTISRKKVI